MKILSRSTRSETLIRVSPFTKRRLEAGHPFLIPVAAVTERENLPAGRCLCSHLPDSGGL
jgi:hypothetical protein